MKLHRNYNMHSSSWSSVYLQSCAGTGKADPNSAPPLRRNHYFHQLLKQSRHHLFAPTLLPYIQIYRHFTLRSLAVSLGQEMDSTARVVPPLRCHHLVLLFAALLAPVASANVPAVYIFGDSTADVGNNNYLSGSNAKANFPHNGIDFPNSRPTGRFSNGYNGVDFLGNQL